MVTERAEDLKTLMHDNATFIQFPPIGSSTSLITVIGDSRVNVQRTIRSIMQLVRSIYQCRYRSLTQFAGLPILRGVVVAAAVLGRQVCRRKVTASLVSDSALRQTDGALRVRRFCPPLPAWRDQLQGSRVQEIAVDCVGARLPRLVLVLPVR